MLLIFKPIFITIQNKNITFSSKNKTFVVFDCSEFAPVKKSTISDTVASSVSEDADNVQVLQDTNPRSLYGSRRTTGVPQDVLHGF